MSFENAISMGFRRAGRQEQEPSATLANQVGGALALVEADIVENDDVAGREPWSDLGLDVALEGRAVRRSVD